MDMVSSHCKVRAANNDPVGAGIHHLVVANRNIMGPVGHFVVVVHDPERWRARGALMIAIDFQEMFREASMPLCSLAQASHSSGPSAP
jgi:hypothetical protein